jgi:hypothetical protein
MYRLHANTWMLKLQLSTAAWRSFLIVSLRRLVVPGHSISSQDPEHLVDGCTIRQGSSAHKSRMIRWAIRKSSNVCSSTGCCVACDAVGRMLKLSDLGTYDCSTLRILHLRCTTMILPMTPGPTNCVILRAPSKVENRGYLGGRERTHGIIMACGNGYAICSIVVKAVAS